MEKLKLERDAARAAGKEGAEEQALVAMEKLATNMDMLKQAGRAFQPEDRRRLDELRKKREARGAEATIDIPEPTVELILDLQPNFATAVRDWLTKAATEGAAPAMGDDDVLRLGVAVAKKSALSRSDYWMLVDMTAEAIKKSDVVAQEASAQTLIMKLRTEGAGKAGSGTDSSCSEGGNLLDNGSQCHDAQVGSERGAVVVDVSQEGAEPGLAKALVAVPTSERRLPPRSLDRERRQGAGRSHLAAQDGVPYIVAPDAPDPVGDLRDAHADDEDRELPHRRGAPAPA